MSKEISKEKKIAIWLSMFAVSLLTAGFCVPPAGVIDGSVLTACGELLGFWAAVLGIDAFKSKYNKGE